MREIKFRVWTGEKYLYGNDAKNDSEFIYLRLDGFGIYPKYGRSNWHENAIIQQYTGIQDRDGKDIYEGDIVRYIQPPVVLMGYPEEAAEIYWNAEGCAWFVRHGCNIFNWCLNPTFAQRSLEIIGNIFENQELLNINQREF